MPGPLEEAARELLSALDAMDVDRMMALATEDAQGVDEISRRWMRGRSELEGYLRQLTEAVSDIRTEFRDVQERVWGDTGALTGWIEQSYTMDGASQQVSAPTTLVYRREGGTWKLAVFHSIPLPEQT
jgi:ketosteroid isomerase-like protein